MKLFQNKWIRFFTGAILVAIILMGTFACLPRWIATYGAKPDEITAIYPGDEILPSPVIMWTHAVTIGVPVEKVWPWIAQIGQSKGGFYSFTFIENMMTDDHSYQNAGAILPQFQNPQPGDEIIQDLLPLKEIQKNKYFLAATNDFFGIGWTWLWYLQPEGETSTRLILRMKIQSPGEPLNSAATFFLDAGGFVMEKAMLRGIQDRAEGRSLPSPVEPLEIFLWSGTFLIGLIAIWQVLRKENWLLPLAIGLVSVVALLVFTFQQPSNILRIVTLAGLFVAIWQCLKWDEDPTKKEQK
jgi:hypothetical protein